MLHPGFSSPMARFPGPSFRTSIIPSYHSILLIFLDDYGFSAGIAARHGSMIFVAHRMDINDRK
jgi:hypothetical protein